MYYVYIFIIFIIINDLLSFVKMNFVTGGSVVIICFFSLYSSALVIQQAGDRTRNAGNPGIYSVIIIATTLPGGTGKNKYQHT